LVGCVDSEQLGNSLQTNSVETVSEIEKTQLTIERVVGEFKMAFSTLIFDKNGTCKAMRGDNVIGSGTWAIKNGEIHAVNDDATKNLVIYEMLNSGDLKHPTGNVAKRIITKNN
jgi:hypothetical protein